jgi:hypothetical protein
MNQRENHTDLKTSFRQPRPKVFSSRKRAPIESLSTSAQVNPDLSSQEPRRPRFSFFSLHNVNELTKAPLPASIVM